MHRFFLLLLWIYFWNI